jgi:hypothetical protein
MAMQQAVKSGIAGLITLATGGNPLLVNPAGGKKTVARVVTLAGFSPLRCLFF